MPLVPAPGRSLCSLLLATAAWGQVHQDFLSVAFASEQADAGLLLSPDMPRLTVANRPVEVKARRGREAMPAAPDSDVTLRARLSREGAFEYCRIRPTPDSSLAPRN